MIEQSDGVILLVEDEAPVRAFASRALRLRGYTVLEADCAEVALELLSDDDLTVDLFVSDVIMPGKDGPTWSAKRSSQDPTPRSSSFRGIPRMRSTTVRPRFRTPFSCQSRFR